MLAGEPEMARVDRPEPWMLDTSSTGVAPVAALAAEPAGAGARGWRPVNGPIPPAGARDPREVADPGTIRSVEMSLAAYRLLVAIAKSDGEIGEDEEVLLARYHRVLGLPDEVEDPDAEDPDASDPLLEETRVWSAASSQERVHLVRMLTRVACADGEIDRRERRMLERVSDALGLSRMEFAGILVAAEDEVHRHRRVRARRRLWAAGVSAVAIVGAVALSWALGLGSGPGAVVEAGAARFKAIEQRARGALLLIQVDYELRSADSRSRRRSTGTGFLLSSTGLIATNKHVLQPWKFTGEPARLVAEGYSLVEGSVRVVAFPAGAKVLDHDGDRVTRDAFDTRDGSLRVVAFAPDHMELQRMDLSDGTRTEHPLHKNDSADLALLQATQPPSVDALGLRAASRPIETLEPVLVLGFPDGTAMLEQGQANPTVALGEVSKVEETLLIQAPLLSGSSGGPVLDAEGRVIGVATRRLAGATYGRCILAVHLRDLCRSEGLELTEP